MTMSPARAADRALDSEHRTITLGLLALVTMFAFEAVAVSLAMPSVARALNGETLYPIAVVGLLTAAIVGMVVGGTWSDARGPGLPLTVGGLGFVAGLLVSGCAGTMEIFVGGRLLQGLGCGAALTAMYVAVADAYPSHLRTRVFSLFATAWVLPSIAGPFIAGALVDLLGWRSVFLVVAAFATVSTVVVRAAMGRRLAVRWGAGWRCATHPWCGAAVRRTPWSSRPGTCSRAARPGRPRAAGGRRRPWCLRRCLRLRGDVPAAGAAGRERPLPDHDRARDDGRRARLDGGVVVRRQAREPETFEGILRAGAVGLLGGAAISLALVPIDHLPLTATLVATVGFTVMAVGMGPATPLTSTLALDLAPVGRQGESGAAIQMSDALGQSIAAGLVGAVFAALLGVLAIAITRRCLTDVRTVEV